MNRVYPPGFQGVYGISYVMGDDTGRGGVHFAEGSEMPTDVPTQKQRVNDEIIIRHIPSLYF